jgi:hypothetical protein
MQLRKRQASSAEDEEVTASSIRKRTSARANKGAAIKEEALLEEEKAVHSEKTTDTGNGTLSAEDSLSNEDSLSIDLESGEEMEYSEDDELSEDEAEVQRIIAKTSAETARLGLTARQRRLHQQSQAEANNVLATAEDNDEEEELVALPLSKPLSEEQMLRKSEKSRRRKIQRDAKLEETKRATIERLLTKQQQQKGKGKSGGKEANLATDQANSESVTNEGSKQVASDSIPAGFYRYIDRRDETLILLPDQETRASFLAQTQ